MFRAFADLGLVISVTCINLDPGNWVLDTSGGAAFDYPLQISIRIPADLKSHMAINFPPNPLSLSFTQNQELEFVIWLMKHGGDIIFLSSFCLSLSFLQLCLFGSLCEFLSTTHQAL